MLIFPKPYFPETSVAPELLTVVKFNVKFKSVYKDNLSSQRCFPYPLILPYVTSFCHLSLSRIIIYFLFLQLSLDLSLFLAVSSLCIFMLCWRKARHPLHCECVHVLFLRLCVSFCVAGRQKVTVSNGPDLEVGSCCICVRALVFRVCVRGCASPHDDGDT